MKFIKKVIKSILFIAILLFILGALLQIEPETYLNLQRKLDAIWLQSSVIRWVVLSAVIVFLPRFYKTKERIYQQRLKEIAAEYEFANSSSASYESLQDLRQYYSNAEKLLATYQSMYRNRFYIAGFLIFIEIIAVQLPHFI